MPGPTAYMLEMQVEVQQAMKELARLQGAYSRHMQQIEAANQSMAKGMDSGLNTQMGAISASIGDLRGGVKSLKDSLGSLDEAFESNYTTALSYAHLLTGHGPLYRAMVTQQKMGTKMSVLLGVLDHKWTKSNKLLGRIAKATTTLYKGQRKLNETLQDNKEGFQGLNDQVGKAMPKSMDKFEAKVAGLVSILAEAKTVKESFDMTQSLLDTQKQIKLTEKELDHLRKIASQIAFNPGVDPEKIVHDLQFAIKSGINDPQVLKALAEVSEKIEIATGQAADTSVAFFTRMRKAADLSIGEITGLGSALVNLAKTSNITVSDLQELEPVMTDVLLRLPKEAQISSIGAFATIAAAQKQAFAGTSLMTNFYSKFTKLNAEAVESMGTVARSLSLTGANAMDFTRILGNLRKGHPEEAFMAMLESVNNVNDSLQAGTLDLAAADMMLAGLEDRVGDTDSSLRKMAKAMRDGTLDMKKLKQQWLAGYNNSGLLNDAVDEQAISLTVMGNKVSAAGKAVAMDFGHPLEKVAVAIVEPAISLFQRFSEWLTSLPESVKIARTAISFLFGGWFLHSAAKFVGGIFLMHTATFGLNAALQVVPGFAGLAARALTFLGVTADAAGTAIAADTLKVNGFNVAMVRSSISMGLVKGSAAILAPVILGLGKTFGLAETYLIAFSNSFANPDSWLKKGAKDLGESLGNISRDVGRTAGLRGAYEYAQTWTAKIPKALGMDGGKSIFQRLFVDPIKSVGSAIGKIMAPSLTIAKTMFETAANGAATFSTFITSTMLPALATFGTWIVSILPASLVTLGNAVIGFAGTAITALGPVLWPILVIGAAILGLYAIVKYGPAKIGEFITKSMEYFADFVDRIPGWINDIVDFLPDALSSIADWIADFPNKIVAMFDSSGQKGGTALTDRFIEALGVIAKAGVKIMATMFIAPIKFAGKLILSIGKLFVSTIWGIGKLIVKTIGSIAKDGGKSLFDGIWEGIKGIGQTFYDWVIAPVIDALELPFNKLRLAWTEFVADQKAFYGRDIEIENKKIQTLSARIAEIEGKRLGLAQGQAEASGQELKNEKELNALRNGELTSEQKMRLLMDAKNVMVRARSVDDFKAQGIVRDRTDQRPGMTVDVAHTKSAGLDKTITDAARATEDLRDGVKTISNAVVDFPKKLYDAATGQVSAADRSTVALLNFASGVTDAAKLLPSLTTQMSKGVADLSKQMKITEKTVYTLNEAGNMQATVLKTIEVAGQKFERVYDRALTYPEMQEKRKTGKYPGPTVPYRDGHYSKRSQIYDIPDKMIDVIKSMDANGKIQADVLDKMYKDQEAAAKTAREAAAAKIEADKKDLESKRASGIVVNMEQVNKQLELAKTQVIDYQKDAQEVLDHMKLLDVGRRPEIVAEQERLQALQKEIDRVQYSLSLLPKDLDVTKAASGPTKVILDGIQSSLKELTPKVFGLAQGKGEEAIQREARNQRTETRGSMYRENDQNTEALTNASNQLAQLMALTKLSQDQARKDELESREKARIEQETANKHLKVIADSLVSILKQSDGATGTNPLMAGPVLGTDHPMRQILMKLGLGVR